MHLKNNKLIELFEQSCKCIHKFENFECEDEEVLEKLNLLEEFQIVEILAESYFNDLKDEDSITFLKLFLNYYSSSLHETNFKNCLCYCFILCDFLYLILEDNTDYWEKKRTIKSIYYNKSSRYFHLKEYYQVDSVFFYLNNRSYLLPLEVLTYEQICLIENTCLFVEEGLREGLSSKGLEQALNVVIDLIYNYTEEDDRLLENTVYYLVTADFIRSESSKLYSSILNDNGEINLISSKLNFLCKSLRIIVNANNSHYKNDIGSIYST